MSEVVSKKKLYYQKNRETILQKQHDRYNRIKDDLKNKYRDSYFLCECGKLVSSFRKELHNASKYHKTRTTRLNTPDTHT